MSHRVLTAEETFAVLGDLCARKPGPDEGDGSERNGQIRLLGWSHEALRAGFGPTTELAAAAFAYGDAQARYKAAYAAWRKAHPNDAYAENQLDLPSWQAEVQPACRAVNQAQVRMGAEAERIYALSCTITDTLKETP